MINRFIDKFIIWLDKQSKFTNAIYLIIILHVILFLGFMFETVDRVMKLESYYNTVVNITELSEGS